jgi:type IV pilus assembly protein PilM
MALAYLDRTSKKRNHIVAIDLGSRTTKAVSLQRQGEGFSLVNFAVQDAPVFEKSFSADVLADHLRSICQTLNAKTKQVSVAVSVADALLRHTELPLVPVGDMRAMLKFNAKMYLQQDLPDHVFDCFILPLAAKGSSAEPAKAAQKCRVLVGAAKNSYIADLQTAIKAAGLIPETITPGMVGTANAFELAQPDAFAKDAVALVDVGFRNSSIIILLNGELILSRVVGIGGDKITGGLAEAMGISYAEAEGIKIGMPTEVQAVLQALLLPLGRELRASIDFFEHQQDKTVSQVFLSGASARSDFVMQTLQSELMIPCKTWNPAGFLTLALSPEKRAEFEQAAPQLNVAVGTAAAEF